MASSMKVTYELIIAALGGIPIMGLVENWSFKIEEVAPYVFKAYGESINHDSVSSFGDTAETALMNCVRKTEKIIASEKRKLWLETILSRIRSAKR